MLYTPITIKHEKYHVKSKISAFCPYCGTCVDPTIKDSSQFINYNSTIIVLLTHYIRCCDKLFFSVHEIKTDENDKRTAELLISYPQAMLKKLPESICNISPRFVELHNQCYWAEKNNFFELAGTGYRNAMEVLIKDFAIKELGESSDEAKKLKLFDAIGKYIPDYRFQNAADVVRIIGNDYTHYERKYDDVEFDYVKIYLDLVIMYVDAQYRLTHPPIPTRNSPSQL